MKVFYWSPYVSPLSGFSNCCHKTIGGIKAGSLNAIRFLIMILNSNVELVGIV